MKTNSKTWLQKGIAIFIVLQMAVISLAIALAQEETPETVEISNVLSVSQLAVWAQIVEDPGEEEIPEGATRLSIVWVPEDATIEADSVVAVIAGSGTLEMVTLERESGWKATAMLTPSTSPMSCSLVGLSGYTVEQSESSIVFTVTLDAAPAEEADLSAILGLGEAPEPTEDDFVLPEDRYVTIDAYVEMQGETLSYGDTVVFTGTLHGYEDLTYDLLWQVDDGSGWTYLPGEHGVTYRMILSPENALNVYRLEVDIHMPDDDGQPDVGGAID